MNTGIGIPSIDVSEEPTVELLAKELHKSAPQSHRCGSRRYMMLQMARWLHCADLNVCYGAPSPCVCQGNVIDCSNKGFHTIPSFNDASLRYNTLLMGENPIMPRRLANNVFNGLQINELHLNSANLDTIDANAFAGLENILTTLNLRDNHFTVLPQALVSLHKLSYLDVSLNPISNFTDNTMRLIGDSVIGFTFGDSNLTEWPASLKHLQQLQELDVEGGYFNLLPYGIFHGFEITLRKLTMNNVRLFTVPLGLAALTNIKELQMDHCFPYGNQALTDQPFQAIGDTLEVLSLRYDSFTEFPKVAKYLYHLKTLRLDGNQLEFISDEAIEIMHNVNVSVLSLSDCHLTRVPGAIGNINYLINLDLSNNKIRSIERTDIHNMNSLMTLSLSGNPLVYISQDSLTKVYNLQTLNLASTNLTVISHAISNLPGLQLLDLSNNKIDCTCDLVWVKKYLIALGEPFKIVGSCETIYLDIQTYLDTFIRDCPEFTRPFGK
ncbi:hypothetical protein CHS0354_022673 [Potamilus streckersoni]|uniref:Uncharacterized protein n=1 Tax=Potamilus streckersoni TaxID=2493646 RepID=A0AAE0S732_9BIVA|nr:hypothetical protein CHS0354_022673 [Potamilus streckersoni]